MTDESVERQPTKNRTKDRTKPLLANLRHQEPRPLTRSRQIRQQQMRRAVQRDARWYARRPRGSSDFWQSMTVLGMVGWPITVGAVGGALLGRSLDAMWQTGVRWTLGGLCVGVILGSYSAWQAMTRHVARKDDEL